MLSKVWTIAYNGLYRVYIDRVALLYMFLAPLAISTIMGLVFGSQDGDISLPEADVLVVNKDQGDHGQRYVEFLVEDTPPDIGELIAGERASHVNEAREDVEKGDANAALIIPEEFSEQISAGEQTAVELYYNPGEDIAVTITLGVIDGITSGYNVNYAAQNIFGSGPDSFFSQWLGPASTPDQIDAVTASVESKLTQGQSVSLIQIDEVNVEGENEDINLMSYFAPAMAILFMTFAMAAGTRAILEERQDWTLQRIITTPTPRWVYMAGRLIGNYTTGFLQMLILIIATPLVALVIGADADIWGDNYLGVLLITLSVVLAGTGLGLLIAGLSKTVTQAEQASTIVLFLLAMIGGSFVQVDQVPVLDTLSRLTLNYWGINGYFDLATDDASLVDILPNVGVLLAMGVIFFGIAVWRFNRRLDF